MKTYQQNNGLLIDNSTNPPTACGYIFSLAGHGAFEPSGKVQLQNGVLRDLKQDEIDTHNRLLGEAEFEALKKHGRGVLYLVTKDARICVSNWIGSQSIPISCQSNGRHNMAGTRKDVWFTLDGSRWHGVNIGDNQICRVKRCKK